MTLGLSFAAAVSAQTVDSLWQGWLSPFVQTGGTAPNFTFQGLFNSNTGFAGSQISQAQHPRLIVFSSNQCYELPIDTITSAGSIIAGRAVDPSGQLSALPSGMAAIYHPSAMHRVGPFISGLSASLQGCLQTFTNLKIDSLETTIQTDATLSGNGTAETALKMAQQGATLGQVLKWNGTTWVPANDDGGAVIYEAFASVSGNTISPSISLPVTERDWRINLYRTGVRMTYGLDFIIAGDDIVLTVPGQDEAFFLLVK
ncbi:MAG: hypothetical protein IT260_08355 [Saprospiraceae bacterium]|nr:hypothetical protein [Saprospiraceae bacterium]